MGELSILITTASAICATSLLVGIARFTPTPGVHSWLLSLVTDIFRSFVRVLRPSGTRKPADLVRSTSDRGCPHEGTPQTHFPPYRPSTHALFAPYISTNFIFEGVPTGYLRTSANHRAFTGRLLSLLPAYGTLSEYYHALLSSLWPLDNLERVEKSTPVLSLPSCALQSVAPWGA